MIYDVVIVGAGPSGTVAAKLLIDQGYKVLIVEKQKFPRFSIGESLLPQAIEILKNAGMLDVVEQAGFQHKNGAAFRHVNRYAEFDFNHKFSAGVGYAYQVQRDVFDHLLAQKVESIGGEILFEHEVEAISINDDSVSIDISNAQQEVTQVKAKFVLDASGFAKVLPRLLNLITPSDLPSRSSVFTHIQDNISDESFDRNKILVTVHEDSRDIWLWLIPFSNGRSSIGMVFADSDLDDIPSEECLRKHLRSDNYLSNLLSDAVFDTPVSDIKGFASNVTQLHGDRYALLGNAAEFLDPVFSSGVTIAIKSAELASQLVDKTLQGHEVDWQSEYTQALKQGIDTFKVYVQAWYEHTFQDIIFYEDKSDSIEQMISSILAGYVWDINNPMVKNSQRGLKALSVLCANDK